MAKTIKEGGMRMAAALRKLFEPESITVSLSTYWDAWAKLQCDDIQGGKIRLDIPLEYNYNDGNDDHNVEIARRVVRILHSKGQKDLARQKICQLDAAGVSLLHWACILGEYDDARLYMELGCDPNIAIGAAAAAAATAAAAAADSQNDDDCFRVIREDLFLGMTPLHCWCESSHHKRSIAGAKQAYRKILGLLLDHGADTNRKDSRGCTPLSLLSVNDDDEELLVDALSQLINHGADIHATIPPSHFSADGGFDFQDGIGFLEGHLLSAIFEANPRYLEFLLGLGADADVTFEMRDGERMTPISLAKGVFSDIDDEFADDDKERMMMKEKMEKILSMLEKYSIRGRLCPMISKDKHGAPIPIPLKYFEQIEQADKELGKGAYGAVTLGNDTVLKHQFAIKRVLPSLLRSGIQEDIEKAQQHVKNEINTLSQILKDMNHPNIACLYGYHVPDNLQGDSMLLFELAPKGSLDKFWETDLGRQRLGSIRCRIQIALDVANALSYLHATKSDGTALVHRDIKSANICLQNDFTAQVIDCGLAKFIKDDKTIDASSGSNRGHPGYVCPFYQQGELDYFVPACDIFSFGVVMAELACGQVQNAKLKQGEPQKQKVNLYRSIVCRNKPWHEYVDPCLDEEYAESQELRDFCNLAVQCMSEDPEDRPTDEQVVVELNRILSVSGQQPLGGPNQNSTNSKKRDPDGRSEAESTSQCRICLRRVVCIACPKNGHLHCANCMTQHVRACINACKKEVGCPLVGCDSPPFDDGGLAGFVVDSAWDQFNGNRAMLRHSERQHNELLVHSETQHAEMIGLQHQMMKLLNNTVRMLTNVAGGVTLRCPRLFVLLEADRKNGWRHPKSWLRSKVQKKYHLYFVCAKTRQCVQPAIKLRANKDWMDAVAPALAVSVTLLIAAATGAAGGVFGLDIVLGLRELKEIHDEVHKALSEDDKELVRRAKEGKLKSSDVHSLDGWAYELLAEKAQTNQLWRDNMQLREEDGVVEWVKKGSV